MQSDGTTICLVEDAGAPLGLITLEDILEQVVGRIEDEYPHEESISVRDALLAGFRPIWVSAWQFHMPAART
jgi:Mg2+/Co2+ transporter CorC